MNYIKMEKVNFKVFENFGNILNNFAKYLDISSTFKHHNGFIVFRFHSILKLFSYQMLV